MVVVWEIMDKVEIPNYIVRWIVEFWKPEDPLFMEIVFYFSWMEFSFCHRVNLTQWKTFWGKIVIYAPLTSRSWFDCQRPHFLPASHDEKTTEHSQVGYPTLFLRLPSPHSMSNFLFSVLLNHQFLFYFFYVLAGYPLELLELQFEQFPPLLLLVRY